MDPEKIKKADRDIVKKLQELRSRLTDRQKKNTENSSNSERFSIKGFLHRPMGLLLATLLIMGGAGLTMLHIKQNPSTTKPPSTMEKKERLSAPEPQLSIQSAVEPISDTSASPIAPESVGHQESAKSQSPNEQPHPTGNDKKNEPEKSIYEENSITDSTPEDAVGQKIQMITAVVCQDIQNHQPHEEKEVFELTKDRRAYVWMEVHSTGQPFAIKHVYYRNHQKYSEVSLDIRYPRMRTWSYVTLGQPTTVGLWKVDIVCNDQILKTVEFQVRGDGEQNG